MKNTMETRVGVPIDREGRRRSRGGRLSAFVLAAAAAVGLGMHAGTAQAIPSFARQTGLQCNACHDPYPQLTDFGRNFKMLGYHLQQGDVPFYKRFSGMLQPSFTHTKKDQPGADSNGTTSNDNLVVNQASVFYGGRVVGKLGAFAQVTYSGPDHVFSWDLTDLRYADSTVIGGKPLIWGIDANNTPTVQDPWNSTPAWGFPFSDSVYDPGLAGPLVAGGLDGTVAGVGAYALWNKTVYAEFNVYQTLGPGFREAVGVHGGIDYGLDGGAPYWRVALQHKSGFHHFEVGTLGLLANVYPGNDRTMGTDRILDTGVDAQYQYANRMHFFTGRLSWIHEDQTLSASVPLGNATNRHNNLDTFQVSGTYLYDQTYGLNLGYGQVTGSSDAALYGGSPNSDYEVIQADWLPFNKSHGPNIWPWFNPKFSVQYTIYNKVNGTTANASDNNTLYLQAWLVF